VVEGGFTDQFLINIPTFLSIKFCNHDIAEDLLKVVINTNSTSPTHLYPPPQKTLKKTPSKKPNQINKNKTFPLKNAKASCRILMNFIQICM
jgi:hypothetical protein